MTQKNIVFLPCRKGSQRVRNKNVREFAGYKLGLLELKLKQLVECISVDHILLSTDDKIIADYAKSLNWGDKILLVNRPDFLATSSAKTDDLVGHVISSVDAIFEGRNNTIMWTHVTSPFVGSDLYSLILDGFKSGVALGYDSLMTVTKIQSFLWEEAGPVNYDPKSEKWPRTQTLPTWFEVNSAAFVASLETYKKHNDRIGAKPMLFELKKQSGFDIDWEDDFELAEQIIKARGPQAQ